MKFILSTAVAAGLATSLFGQNLLINGDFETPATAGSPVPAWTVSGAGAIEEVNEGTTSGSNSAVFNIGGGPEGTVISQSFATVAGVSYRLTFDAGIFGTPSGSPLQLEATVFGSGVQALADRIVFPPAAFTFDPASVVFRHYEIIFTANSSTTVVQFTDHGAGNLSADTLLDTVSVVAVLNPPPNLLTNGDFETQPFNITGTVSGWTVGGNGQVADQSDEGATSSSHAAAFNVAGDSAGNTLSQSFATSAGTVYLLKFDTGMFGQPTSPMQLQVQLLGSGTLLDQSVTPPVTGPGLIDFQQYEFMFTANSPVTTLRFTDLGTGNGGADLILDTVSVTPKSTPAATPTPTPTPIPTPTPTPTPTPSPTPTPTPTPNPTPTPSPTATPTPTPRPSPTPTPTPHPTPTPTVTPTATPTPTVNPRPSPSPTPTPTATVSPRPSPTPKPTIRPSPTPKPTIRPSPTPKPTPRPTATPAPEIRISVSANKVEEGQTAVVTISLSRALSTPFTVHYSIGGSAALGQDYSLSGTPGTIVIPAGQLSAMVVLTALTDNVAEKQELVTFTVTGGAHGRDSVKVFIAKQKQNKGHGHRR